MFIALLIGCAEGYVVAMAKVRLWLHERVMQDPVKTVSGAAGLVLNEG